MGAFFIPARGVANDFPGAKKNPRRRGSVSYTHLDVYKRQVKPWVGPSSILLGLMASGLDGQRFAFHGYAPVDAGERARQLKAWEQHSARHNQTQLLIETPYRNAAMFATLLASLKGDTKLCVARALTTADEWIATRTIDVYKRQIFLRPALL